MDLKQIEHLPYPEVYWHSNLRRDPEEAIGHDLLRKIKVLSRTPGITNEATVMALVGDIGPVAIQRFMRYLMVCGGPSVAFADLHIRRFKQNNGVYYVLSDALTYALETSAPPADLRCDSVRCQSPNIYILFGGAERPGLGVFQDDGGAARLEGAFVSETVTTAAMEDSLRPTVFEGHGIESELTTTKLLPPGFPRDKPYRVLECMFTAAPVTNGVADNLARFICGQISLRIPDETWLFSDIVQATWRYSQERTARLDASHDPLVKMAMGAKREVDGDDNLYGNDRTMAAAIETAKALYAIREGGCRIEASSLPNVSMAVFAVDTR